VEVSITDAESIIIFINYFNMLLPLCRAGHILNVLPIIIILPIIPEQIVLLLKIR